MSAIGSVPGLDPVIHRKVEFKMDCRVKPGNDDGESGAW